MIDKNAVLKVVNPALAILILNQAFSAVLSEVTDWDFFEGLHVGGGVLLLCAAAVHLMLNWRWVAANFLRNVEKQRS
jgi:protein-S-isoprenylcysteine O-methyltransferase Ste14